MATSTPILIPPAPATTHPWPELLAPAGNWDCARAAVENGADAIYFGVDRFNARMRADNFTLADLPELMAWLHRRGVRGYITFNTLVFTSELDEAEAFLREIMAAGVDAAIVQDMGICRLIRHLSPDFPIHGSTQMTITSAAGVTFAQDLGCNLVVLARECSLVDIEAIQTQTAQRLPLEIFVHGALCVAYSGQCLTSESLGGRSANRGECAQACRMTYDLIADGQPVDLGDRHYLLSPQDLTGLELLPQVVRAGLTSLKIEGRLKTPDYVAAVTRIYRQNLDALAQDPSQPWAVAPDDRYGLEMAFSRGLYGGWLGGIDNQALVHGRFGKKRGVYLGEVSQVQGDRILITLAQPDRPLKAGDGVLFERGEADQGQEVGGRIYQVDGAQATGGNDRPLAHPKPKQSPQGQESRRPLAQTPLAIPPHRYWLSFRHHQFAPGAVRPGDRVWKTSDPAWERQVRQTYQQEQPQAKRPLRMVVMGTIDQPLRLTLEDDQGHRLTLDSDLPLQPAEHQPLTTDRLEAQLGRLGHTPFYLAQLDNRLVGDVILPLKELNRLRRDALVALEEQRSQPRSWSIQTTAHWRELLPEVCPQVLPDTSPPPHLLPLVRSLTQLQAVLTYGSQRAITPSTPSLTRIYCELEDPRRYREAMALVREATWNPTLELFVAPPRITKPKEQWILKQVRQAQAHGYLIRNYDHLEVFQGDPCVADFSYNVANPLTAAYLKRQFPQLERLTASYDLTGSQVIDLAQALPSPWLEVTLHQHMPLFHMEHCVFCAFLSRGTDHTNCGRPCESQRVELRDRVGTRHLLQADAGCRNTLFNGTAQTGAEWFDRFRQAGLSQFRVEFLQESPEQVLEILSQYDRLLHGTISGEQLWQTLRHYHLQNQLGVTRGSLRDSKLKG